MTNFKHGNKAIRSNFKLLTKNWKCLSQIYYVVQLYNRHNINQCNVMLNIIFSDRYLIFYTIQGGNTNYFISFQMRITLFTVQYLRMFFLLNLYVFTLQFEHDVVPKLLPIFNLFDIKRCLFFTEFYLI